MRNIGGEVNPVGVAPFGLAYPSINLSGSGAGQGNTRLRRSECSMLQEQTCHYGFDAYTRTGILGDRFLRDLYPHRLTERACLSSSGEVALIVDSTHFLTRSIAKFQPGNRILKLVEGHSSEPLFLA